MAAIAVALAQLRWLLFFKSKSFLFGENKTFTEACKSAKPFRLDAGASAAAAGDAAASGHISEQWKI